MPVRISDYRLSFIWTEPVLDALTGALDAAKAPLPTALLRGPYVDWLDDAQRSWPAPDAPVPPWPPHGRQGFWEWYLDSRRSLKDVTGAIAWRHVVPIRLPALFEIAYDGGTATVHLQGYAHPWGVALTLDVTWSGRADSARDVIQQLLDARNGARLLRKGAPVHLQPLAADALAAMQAEVFGTDRGNAAAPEPFSIFTVLRADGTAAELDPANDDDLHRLIQTAASFSQSWEMDKLEDLGGGRVAQRKHQPDIHYVFGASRGRSVWGPAWLSREHPKSTLSCQHRNLLFASLQAESLMALAKATTAGPLTGDHESAARRGMAALGGLYLGGDSTYKTGSVKAQVQASGALPAVNALRERLGLQKL